MDARKWPATSKAFENVKDASPLIAAAAMIVGLGGGSAVSFAHNTHLEYTHSSAIEARTLQEDPEVQLYRDILRENTHIDDYVRDSALQSTYATLGQDPEVQAYVDARHEVIQARSFPLFIGALVSGLLLPFLIAGAYVGQHWRDEKKEYEALEHAQAQQ